MCGIAGFLELKRQTGADDLAAAARAMTDTMIHRGPDSGDTWSDADAGVALAFRRLAIIDLSASGDQPMVSANGRYVVVYNGEVYNFQELREELTGKGARFRGDSDTEVMLEGFAHWGVEATVKRLIGMFAFALWDREERRLWLGRDRLGIKPLYYGESDGLFLFGSELKALRAKEGWQPRIDRDALASYARFNYVPAPQSIYAGIRKLEPGTLLSYTPGSAPELVRYWDMASVATQPRRDIGDAEAIAEAEALLTDAVARRMVSDVPLGALLSGGVDSATVVALMQKSSTRPIRTFTIGFQEQGFDESEHARAVADHLGTEHTDIAMAPGHARDIIPRLADWYDEPFADASALPTRLVSELARRHVTVALSGDGGDETFLGYNRYHTADALWQRMQHAPAPLRRMAAGLLGGVSARHWDRLSKMIPASRRPSLAGDKAHKLAAALRETDEDGIYRCLVSHWNESIAINGSNQNASAWESAGDITDFSERMAYLDTMTYLPDDILTKVDRASMSVSLEARTPLLDHRLLEFAWSLPKRMRLRNGERKWLLRQVLHRHVPRTMVERPKSGFAVPIADWLRGPLRDWAENLIDEQRLREEGWFDPIPIRRAWSDHLAGDGNHWQALWGICMAQAWRERWATGVET
ncbi:MAG: asparagine synthase (glutamine-hydrolyzing) [Alphaproteobacteria bacterium]|nr:asparagine synthase (glutamine-hydrolyzing) [Alphaproteobacteria bacterium]